MTILEKANTGEAAKAKNPAIAEYRAKRDQDNKTALEEGLQAVVTHSNELKAAKAPTGFGVMSVGGVNAVEDFVMDNVLPAADDGKVNLFHRDQFKSGLMLEIPLWVPSGGDDGSFDYVTLHVNGVPVVNGVEDGVQYTYKFEVPVAATDLPGRFVIPFNSLKVGGDGIKLIGYSVYSNETGNKEESEIQLLTLDLLDPALNDNPAPIEYPADVTDGVGTLKYLAEHSGTLTLHVPPYFDYYPGDKYQLYIAGNPVPVRSGDVPPEAEDDGFDIELDEDTIKAIGEGVSVLQYKLEDRAGNRSDFSIPVHLTVRLTPEPEDLLKPLVPAAPISREDARTGVEAIVPAFKNAQAGDEIRVYYRDEDTVKVIIWPNDRVTFNWDEIALPNDQVKDPAVRVWYDVIRGKNTWTSPDTEVAVDLTTIGPDPVGPGPINATLVPVRAQGNSSKQPGFIRPADVGSGAVLLFTVYENAKVGEFVRLFYGRKDNAVTHTIAAGETPGTVISIPIPWNFVESLGNGTIAIGYEIQETETTGNPQQAVDGSVEVSIATVTVTAKVTFPDRIGGSSDVPGTTPVTALGILNCERPRPLPDGIRLAIAERAGVLSKDDLVFITLSVCSDKAGSIVVTDRTREIPVVVSDQEATSNRIERVLPLLKSYFEIADQPGKYYELGSFRASWRIVKAGNIPGSSQASAVRYALRKPGGGLCLPQS